MEQESYPEITSDYIAGIEDMRILFFQELRDLISEKVEDNDDIAANVLGWAYEKLGEVT